LEFVCRARRQHQARAALVQEPRRGLADAHRGAGDDDYFAVDVHIFL